MHSAWPFNDCGNPQAALVKAALESPQTGHARQFRIVLADGRLQLGIGQATIVGGEPKQRVFGDAQFAQGCSKAANAPVHGNQFAVMVPCGNRQCRKCCLILFTGLPRSMRATKPDDGERGLIG